MERVTVQTPTRRTDLPVAEVEMDAHLERSLRRASVMRQGFYIVVLLVALAGQVSGAVEALGIPLIAAIPAVGALELGGIVVLANADVRRRLGERAIGSRLLSVTIAAGAVAFNWMAHEDHLLGGFFAGMSALGYLVWLMHTENQRRDRLRAKGDLPPTTPAYETVSHWLRHPLLTQRAKGLAKADPGLGLYGSLAAARAEVRRERRQAAISKVLHRKIRSAVNPNTADIAIAVYDLDEIARRLAERADYDGLTSLIAADLAPSRLGLAAEDDGAPGAARPHAQPGPGAGSESGPLPGDGVGDAPGVVAALPGSAGVREGLPGPAGASATDESTAVFPIVTPAGGNPAEDNAAGDAGAATDGGTDDRSSDSSAPGRPGRTRSGAPVGRARPASGSVLDPALLRDVADRLGRARPAQDPASTPREETARRTRRGTSGRGATAGAGRAGDGAAMEPASGDGLVVPGGTRSASGDSLRRRVHTALDAHVTADAQHDESSLVELVSDVLDLTDVERLSAASYVRSWAQDGSRASVPAAGAAG